MEKRKLKNIILGSLTDNSEKLVLKIEPKKTGATHIMGITGSRKTSLQLEVIRQAKQEPNPIPVVIISSELDEAVLRTDFDFIMIGDSRAEVPISVESAFVMGETIRKSNLDVIVDINALKTEKERDEFIFQFIEGMMLNRDHSYWKNPCIIMIDEVQLYCNSTQTKARDAIINLLNRGRKRSLIAIFASHLLKDMYWKARREIKNTIIGFLKDPGEREQACELLMIPKSEAEKIAEFQQEPYGRFYAEGSDIIYPAKIFILENKRYPDIDDSIPQIGIAGKEKARKLVNQIRESISKVTIEPENKKESEIINLLQGHLSELEDENKKLRQVKKTPEEIQRMIIDAKNAGWGEATRDFMGELLDWKKRVENSKLMGIIRSKPIIVIFERMENGLVRPIEFKKH